MAATDSEQKPEPATNDAVASANAAPEVLAQVKPLSTDDVEKMISEHDPSFAETVSLLSAEDGLNVLGLVDLDHAFEEERRKSLKFRLKVGFSKAIYKIEFASLSLVRNTKDLFLVHLPYLGKLTLAKLKILGGKLKQAATDFSALSKKQKMAAGVLVLMSIGFLFLVKFILSGREFLQPAEQHFVLNLMGEAGEVIHFKPDEDMEPFFDSSRVQKSVILISRIVVNLRATPKSGPSPMLAIELFLESLSEDAILEVKDREAEFKDLIERKLEEMSYSVLDSQEGKYLMLERVREEVNRSLTSGRIRQARIKTIVLKP